MYKVFTSLDDLYNEIDTDKHWQGAESGLRNRYPLRFVMFENFCDFDNFVLECTNHNIFVQSMEKWLPNNSEDQLITYSQLARRFKEYVKSLPASDFVIAPFSEIVRFYNNSEYSEFNSLVQTIRLIESPEESQLSHQRIYLPIIGMQGKMNKFKDDPNIHIWEYRGSGDGELYNLVLTRGTTYGVQGLEKEYTVCKNMREWIALWHNGSKVKKNIICTSKVIYDNSHYAQPDNAFKYKICSNAFEFLTKGLGLHFDCVELKEEELQYWNELAACVDISNFDFEKFVNERFNTNDFLDIHIFVQTWFDNKDGFSRWLIRTYLLQNYGDSTYLNRVLKQCNNPTTSEVFSKLATHIFDEPHDEAEISQRRTLLKEAARRNVVITEIAEKKLQAKLSAFASDPERGYHYAMKFMTPLTSSELFLMIKWLGEGNIQRSEVKDLFPQLYSYTSNFILQLPESDIWVNDYIIEYVTSKIANRPTEKLESYISVKNKEEISFNQWHNHFKTVKTFLYNRDDIDIYYWIDGLGIDWIPYILNIINGHSSDGVYLNEVYIATTELPTTTAINKPKLEEMSKGELFKIGDIDSYAHSQKKFPSYICEEFKIIEQSVNKVLSQYNGKKIAFISDHGISYMAQFGKGLNIAGIAPDHGGRCGKLETGNASHDNNYIILSDNSTVCSLTHNSLSIKTSEGQGAHGGATPEEVLVPIIIVSGQKNASHFSAKLVSDDITATEPVVKYIIKGLSTIDVPKVIYNGAEYSMHKTLGDTYVSERMMLVETSIKIILVIGDFKQTDTITIHTGIEEDNLFDF